MLGLVPSASLLGIDGHAVTVEVHFSTGLPSFTVVGLPDTSCREARDRVRAAAPVERPEVARSAGHREPRAHRRCARSARASTSPSRSPSSWPAATVTQEAVGDRAFLGELGLDGTVRPVPGTICLTEALGDRPLVLPAAERRWRGGSSGERVVHPVPTLAEVVACLRGEQPWPDGSARSPPVAPRRVGPDLRDVRGQPVARYALEVAAAGGHHLLLLGPPGAGKTMLAARLPGLLPALADAEALETTRIHSAAGLPAARDPG